jgi:hypothetical protein
MVHYPEDPLAACSWLFPLRGGLPDAWILRFKFKLPRLSRVIGEMIWISKSFPKYFGIHFTDKTYKAPPRRAVPPHGAAGESI